MKTLVTGGNGFIGSHLVGMLVEQGRDVAVTVNPMSAHGRAEAAISVEPREGDLRDYRDARRVVEGVDTVFHLAARIGNLGYLHGTQTAELMCMQTNITIDANVFRACLESGVKKIVYASSCAVYAIDKQMTSGAVFNESDLQLTPLFDPAAVRPGMINPDGGYGWAKLMGEIQLWWSKGVEVGIGRIFSAYGENAPLGERSHAMEALIQRAIRTDGGDFRVSGDGRQSRDFLYVTDCARALLKLEERASIPPITANIGSGRPVTIGELAKKIVAVSGKQLNLVFDTTQPMGPISRTADVTNTQSLLSWKPEVSLDEGIRTTYGWIERKLGLRNDDSR